jgi:hypothetical protein
MTKNNNHPHPHPMQHGDTPPNLNVPVHRHSSETVRAPNDAGGEVPRGQYEGNAPKNAGEA